MAQSINIGVIFNAVNRTGNIFSRVNGQVNRLESRVQNFNSKVTGLFSIPSMIGVGAGIGFLKLGADMEQTNVAFRVMLGNAEKASAVLNKLNNFSNVTPFQNKEVIQAGRNLIAFGVEAEKIESVMQRVGDVASGVKMPFSELADIYGKIKVGNTVYNEDLNQLAGRGIPIFTELAKVMNVPVAQIKKLSSEGKITFKEIDQAFVNMTSSGGKYAGMMKEMSKTAGGAWSTALGKLVDGITKLSVSVMPVMTNMINAIIPVIDAFNEFSQAHPELLKNILMVAGGLLTLNIAGKVFGVLRAGALVLSSGFLQPVASLGRWIKATRLLNATHRAGRIEAYTAMISRYGIAGRVAAAGIWAKNSAVSAGNFIAKLFNAQTRKAILLQIWQTTVSRLQAAGMWVWSKAMKLGSMSLNMLKKGFIGVIAKTWMWTAALLANPITWIVIGIMALVAGIALAWKHFSWFRGGIIGTWETIKKFGQILWQSIIEPIKLIIGGIGRLVKAFQLLKQKDFSGAWKEVKGGLADIGKGMIKATPIGVMMKMTKRHSEIGEAWEKGYEKGKNIDTTNFLNFKKNKPVDLMDMQIPGFDQANQAAKLENTAKVVNMTPQWLPESGSADNRSVNLHNRTENTDNHSTNLYNRTENTDNEYNQLNNDNRVNNQSLSQLTKNITHNLSTSNINDNTSHRQQSHIEINYQPQVHVSTALTKESQDNLMQLLYADKEQLIKLINEEQRKEGRLSYAG